MKQEFLSVKGVTETLEIIERSKFICKLSYVENEDEAKEFIKSVKKEHSLATHNCYAYIADTDGLNFKFSDDGEPQGTAGIPMLEALKSKGLKKVCAVVTRYFGGIKLGTGGLARAYGGAVINAIDRAEKVTKSLSMIMRVNLTYENFSAFIKLAERFKIKHTVEYGEVITVEFAVKLTEVENFNSALMEAFSGTVTATEVKKEFV